MTDREIEAVARAICGTRDPDATTATMGWAATGWGPTKRLEEPRPIKVWQLFEARARLAIAALDNLRGGQHE